MVLPLATFAAPASAAGPPATRSHGAPAAAIAPAFDVRDAQRAQLDGRPPRGFAATAAVRAARTAYARALGPRAVVDIDPLTQTPRDVQRLDGSLSAPSAAAAATVALGYVRTRLSALGLSAGDLDTLGDRSQYTSSDGVTHLRWAQSYRGIPAYDNDLRVNVDSAGRVIDVLGSPRHDLSVTSTTPALDAAQALRAVQGTVGDSRAVIALGGPSGPTQATTFSGGDGARLVLFGAGTVRLAWDVTDAASPDAVYDAVVDATTGRILSSENLVDFDSMVNVFAHYPGAAVGGTQEMQDITPYLSASPPATTLIGPNAHAFSDLDNDSSARSDPGQPDDEEVEPSAGPGQDWLYPFTDFTSTNLGGSCLATDLCSWDDTVPGSWMINRQEAATQLFWFVNEYHDHLLAPPIDFDDASGAFDGNDPLIARSDVGAATGPGGNPADSEVDNSSMLTRPNGQSPVMTVGLYSSGSDPSFRDVNGADDAAVVFHEYTHGLSNRLITNDDGTGALSEVQSAAMGEGWSDWYAMDEIVDLGLDTDNPLVPGEISFGEYTDAMPDATRSEPIDCPVSSVPEPNCPGTPTAGPGGYTYGDMGHICTCGNEPHFDGEIWGQTLWDLRTALIAQTDPITGSQLAEQLITGAMRLSPPQPTMLDERNAILAEDEADPALNGIYDHLIWTVFASRGMGWFASTVDANDGAPIQDFSMPPSAPAPGVPQGTVKGTVTDAISGLPMSGVEAGFGGHDTSFDPLFAATTIAGLSDSTGAYSLSDVPAGTYPQLVFRGPDGYDPGVVGPVVVTDGQTVTDDVALRRDWAASAGGARFTTTDDTQSSFGCGAVNATDQSPRGWSTLRSHPASITIALPRTIDVTGFAINPTATCGDDPSAGLRDYEIDTSTDGGASFAVAQSGTFGPAAAGHLDALTPTANAKAVTDVRLTLLDPQCAASCTLSQFGSSFTDLTEFEIFGAAPNVLPSGTLTATPDAVQAGSTQVSLQAQFTDPDSKITGYAWDFDGDGIVDQTTTTPTVTHVYPAAGTFTATVAAQDFRGGAGAATARVRVTPPVVVTPTTPTPVTTTVTTTVTVPAPAPVPEPVAHLTKPILKLSPSGRRGVAFTVTFATRGTSHATLTVSQALARTLHVTSARFVVATLTSTVTSATPRTVTIRLPVATLAALTRHRLATLHAVLGVTATAADGQVATATRHVTISR